MKITGLLIPDVEALFEIILKEIDKEGESFQNFSEKEQSTIIEAFDEKIIEYFKDKTSDSFEMFLEMTSQNQMMIESLNKETFKYFYDYLKLSHDLYHSLRKSLTGIKSSESDNIIISYYGYLVRISDQVFVMLLNGYPDGGMRLWRSLYEHAVINLLFIEEKNNDVLFERFIAYEHKARARKIESYNKNFEKLKFPALDQDIEDSSKSLGDNLKTKYGNNFLDFSKEYAWASILYEDGKANFRKIEESVNLEKLRPFYISASSYIHPTFESLFDFLEHGNVVNLAKITSQTTDKQSFSDPLQLTLFTLHEVNMQLLNLYCIDHEVEINVKLFKRIFEMMQKHLV